MAGGGPDGNGDEEPWLLRAPRGRRLCYEVLVAAVQETIPFDAWGREPAAEVAAELARMVGRLQAGLAWASEDHVLTALVESVAMARYWQEPDDTDLGLAALEVRGVLRQLALALGDALPPWWGEPVALDRQRVVTWVDPRLPWPPPLTGSSQALAEWRRETVEDEERARRERPADIRANWSGRWWSTPAGRRRPPSTSRALDVVGAAGLVLVEDSLGWTAADCLPVAPGPRVRVREVHGPADWVELVARHPLEVTSSRRHDWWRTTGVDGRWFVPDWPAVSQDYDAVHVSVRGYLTTAGLPLPVGEGWTLLAGWEPDASWWLTDHLRAVGDAERWVLEDQGEPLGWRRELPGPRERIEP
ncbi:MAG: hypothetical protein ACTHOD_03235 [Motilibacteraceae bacterium]